MHHVAVALDRAIGLHVHAAGARHATEVVARQIHQHHMFGIFLGIGAQLRFVTLIFNRIGAARPGAGDGPQLGLSGVELHQRLG